MRRPGFVTFVSRAAAVWLGTAVAAIGRIPLPEQAPPVQEDRRGLR